jgi:hypothetical protein
VPGLPYTPNEIQERLGDRFTVFSCMETWDTKTLNNWAKVIAAAATDDSTSSLHATARNSAYTFTLNIRAFVPPSETRESTLGERLALIARYLPAARRLRPQDGISLEPVLRATATSAWAEFIAAGASGVAVSDIARDPLTDFICAHMARRSEAMQVYLNACGLPAIIPLFLKQASDVETFLADTSCRLRSVRPSGSHTDGDAHYNNGWYDLLVPFFREIALVSIAPGPRFGPAALAAAAAAGCARATSMLAASAAPAAPAPALPFPPFAAPGPAPASAPPPPPPSPGRGEP